MDDEDKSKPIDPLVFHRVAEAFHRAGTTGITFTGAKSTTSAVSGEPQAFGPGSTIGAGGGAVGPERPKPARAQVRDSAPLAVKTTRPREIKRHDISDEELEMLEGTNRDGMSEKFWAMVGIAGGALPPAAEALYNAYIATTPVPLSILHLIEVGLFFICGAVAIAIKLIDGSRSQRATDIISRIRKRRAS